MIFSQTTATTKIKALDKKIRIVAGGTSASKSISILLYLIGMAQSDTNPTLTSIISESTPHLKRGVMRDFKNIMLGHGYWKDDRWNATDSIYTFETNSKVEFFSADQSDKLRGARRDRCFVNEANNVTLDAFDQLEVRTKDFIFLDYNPTSEFWVYTDVLHQRKDVDFITLTYLDNEALSEEIVKSIESRRERKGWWKCYGLGQLGEVEGKIYKNWQIIDEIPHEARLERRGLDFGFSCLKGDTIIETRTGGKRIDKIRVGDEVLTRNGYKKVNRFLDKGLKEVYSLDFGLKTPIIMTSDHRVYTQDGWKESCQLLSNETICVLEKNLKEEYVQKNVQISYQPIKEKQKVYDLTIDGEHEFFANGVLVHNCDPTVIVDIYKYNGGFIIDEITYQKGLSNKQIADIIINQENNALCVADSAEPKSIDEIRSYGVNIIGATKGAGSVMQGIQYVQDQRISVTKRSVNTIKCYRNYLWKTDREGRVINIPEHTFSDPMDCLIKGTKIKTQYCDVSIENIKRGDLVFTRKGYQMVLDSWLVKKDAQVYEITLSNGSTLTGTENHRIWTNAGWTFLTDIRYGDTLCIWKQKEDITAKIISSTQEQDFAHATVLKVKKIKELQEVYDITVKDHNEYFANGILVHNSIRYGLSAYKEPKKNAGRVAARQYYRNINNNNYIHR